ncbi:bifunctional anthranilate synthase component I family protein/class IV aminotransferase [bacterium]|nr:bifunctional anthranilate synthase component I family protein/class IV aminotransferase [bacterium]
MQIYADKLFSEPCAVIEVFEPEKLEEGFREIEKFQKQGYYLLGYIRYDLLKPLKDRPLLYFEAYKDYKKYKPSKSNKKIGILLKPKISKEEYIKKVEFIKNKIKEGVTYEVNYTYPFELKTNAKDTELYEFLLERQKTPYCAFFNNKYETILSFSPEMFFTLKGKNILTKPMKGTIKKGYSKKENKKRREFLYNDIKNRAENIMIVDLLRNDLGKIAKTNSVKVGKLFDIEEHKTLFQMTSEISAKLLDDINLYDIFKAIFPCGSITGAPKLSTMRIIEQTEKYPREVYCGAIGYIHKNSSIFSVPIRIIQKEAKKKDYTYFSGSAIVWDSKAQEEWEETITKAKFLETDFSIIETGIDNWDLHIKRMKNSADALGFKWNKDIEKLNFQKNIVSRIELFKTGEYKISNRLIPDIPYNPKIRIKNKINTNNPFLYHKTSIRNEMPKDVFDEIQVNERGEITEGTYTNIGILKNGKYYTPPVSSGLLNGIFRQKLNW